MSVKESKKFSGMTEEDAVARACAELGLMRSEIEYKVIEPGGRGLFGLVKKDVVIMAWAKSGTQKKADVKSVLSKNEYGFSLDTNPNFQNSKKETPQNPKDERAKYGDKNTEQKSRKSVEPQKNQHKKERGRERGGERNRKREDDERFQGKPEQSNKRRNSGNGRRGSGHPPRGERRTRKIALLPPEEEKALFEQKAGTGKDFLKNLFNLMRLDADVYASNNGGLISFSIKGEKIAELLEKEERFISDLQHILDKVVNKGENSPKRPVSISQEKPLTKRELNLKQEIKRISQKAISLGKPITIGPMSASDRRIAHLAAREVEGVRTESRGDEPNRRIAIIPLNPSQKEPSPTPENREE
ncbi:MAG: hypothetical protein Kow0090_08100 [Myxococcota bacterium]